MANITLSSSASSVTFSNIPNTYRDLIIVCNVTGTAANTLYARYNGDSGSNYSFVYANGRSGNAYSSSSSSTATGALMGATNIGLPTSGQATSILQVLDYAVTDKHKSALARYSNSSNEVEMIASRWANTNAINTLAIVIPGTTIASGSTFALYGIAG